jgi:predicted nuclease of restriction endonuclease-like (RecB) superfamily
LTYFNDPLKREFYEEMCRGEGWSTRTLPEWVDPMLYDSTALSRQADELIAQELATLRAEDQLTPNLLLQQRYYCA